MGNEIILVFSLFCTYGSVLLAYKFLNKTGLYTWTAIATILANIEVLILVDAFGIEQTLGNILFASTFLVTDILSETEGREKAQKAVKVGIFANIAFILVSQSWFLYTPSEADWVMSSMFDIFGPIYRVLVAGLVTYVLCQFLDVSVYHYIWEKTTKMFGNKKRGLWLRNNISTIVSQTVNSFVFNFSAFYGSEMDGMVYDFKTTFSISVATIIIFVMTSLLDTPVVYLARKIKEKQQ